MNANDVSQALARFVQRQTGAAYVGILAFSRLSGGAIQSNFAFSVECEGGLMPGRHDWVVRTDAPSRIQASLTREQEFKVVELAYEAGVTVPQPVWLCTDTSVIGQAFSIMARMDGTASGRQLVRSGMSDTLAVSLVRQLGHELARLHRIKPPQERLDFLPVPRLSSDLARVHAYRKALDCIPEPHPVLEWSLNWLEDCATGDDEVVLCHGDFRTGNYMVQDGRITGILDWEFAAFSNPLEDLGWLCARSWRFGAVGKEVGGVGHKADLFAAYSEASGRDVNADKVLYWEVMGMTRWAIIALQQAQRHLSGEQRSLELALTGHLLPEIEFDLLNQIQHMMEAQ